MDCCELCLARHFECADPDGALTAYQRKRIVANDLCRSRYFKSNRIGRKRTNRAEFIGDSQDNARGVGTVACQGGVIGRKRKLLVGSAA